MNLVSSFFHLVHPACWSISLFPILMINNISLFKLQSKPFGKKMIQRGWKICTKKFSKILRLRKGPPLYGYFREPAIFLLAISKESRHKSFSLNGRAIKRGGWGVKGRAIKEKITFSGTLFFPTFLNFNGH